MHASLDLPKASVTDRSGEMLCLHYLCTLRSYDLSLAAFILSDSHGRQLGLAIQHCNMSRAMQCCGVYNS